MKKELFELHDAVEDTHWWFVGRRRIIQRLVRAALPPSKDSVVVDVGCGTGANIAALAADYSCVGIDPTPEAVEFAARRFPGVRFICGYAPEDLGDVASQASMYLLNDVLEHVPDDFAMLSELLAESAPGTQFLITVPAHESLWSEHDVSFGHYRRYDAERLASVWDGLPVTVRLLSYYNARLYPIVRGVRTLSRLRGHAGGERGTDLSLPPSPVNRALTAVFAGEGAALERSLRTSSPAPYRTGVSLVAVLRRDAGRITPRALPTHVARDVHQPASHQPASHQPLHQPA